MLLIAGTFICYLKEMIMNKITFVIPSRNNLEFLELAYKSIRNLKTKHEILILDDASTDGTSEWITSLTDPDLLHYHNPGPERIGIVGMFDKGIEIARTEIIMAFHADMVAGPDLDTNILKHLKPGTVVSATRIEPPLHPPGVEKITVDFGIEAEQFDFDKWYTESEALKQDKTTKGIFAPWCMYKSDFLGHDDLFAPQSKEDSDLFNRFILSGYEVIQSWDALVYHFTCRGSRFNKQSGGGAGKNSNEWIHTTNKNSRNFIRKWGHFVKHDEYMNPIIPSKYNIGFVVKNCNMNILEMLEPWCDNIYIEDMNLVNEYILREQPNTKFILNNRVKNINNISGNDVLIEFDGKLFGQSQFDFIQNLSEVLKDSAEVGIMEYDIFKFTINSLDTYEKTLINCKTNII